jgi:hypothetical protein
VFPGALVVRRDVAHLLHFLLPGHSRRVAPWCFYSSEERSPELLTLVVGGKSWDAVTRRGAEGQRCRGEMETRGQGEGEHASKGSLRNGEPGKRERTKC